MAKKILLGVICIMIAFSFVGCGGNNQQGLEINFKVGYKNTVSIDIDQDYELIELCNAYDEWINMRESKSYLLEVNEYDMQYFENSLLIICAFCNPTSFDDIEVESVKISEQKILVTMKLLYGTMINDAISHGIFIIEVKKADIQDISSVTLTRA